MHGPTVTRLRSAGTQAQHSVTQGRRKPRPLSHAVTFWVTSATTRFHTHPSATPWPSPMHVHTHTGTRDHLRAHNPPFAHRLPRAGTPLHTHKHTHPHTCASVRGTASAHSPQSRHTDLELHAVNPMLSPAFSLSLPSRAGPRVEQKPSVPSSPPPLLSRLASSAFVLLQLSLSGSLSRVAGTLDHGCQRYKGRTGVVRARAAAVGALGRGCGQVSASNIQGGT